MIRLVVSSIAFAVVALVGIVLVPVALQFRVNGSSTREATGYRLPWWAAWWDDPLNTMSGDKYWRADHHPNNYNSKWVQFLWYLRNPATGFGTEVIGVWHQQLVSVRRTSWFLTVCAFDGEHLPMFWWKNRLFEFRIGPDNTNYTTPGEYTYPFTILIRRTK